MSQQNSRKKNIFISYRVSDTAGETGRLADCLKQVFNNDQIFMDIDKLEPGVDFTEVISKSLEACDVMLVIIGPNWAGLNSDGTSRIKNPNDWVNLEVSTALKRNIRVVPVLVDGASLPTANDLPEDLEPLVRRQTYEISNKRWKYDTDQLIDFLKNSIGIQPRVMQNAATTPKKAGASPWMKVLAGIGVLAIIIVLAVMFYEDGTGTTDTHVDPLVNTNEASTSEETTDNTTGTYAATDADLLDGVWDTQDQQEYWIISHNNEGLQVQFHTAQGSFNGEGYIENNKVHVTIPIEQSSVRLLLSLSADGNELRGTGTVSENGASYSEQIYMFKRK